MAVSKTSERIESYNPATKELVGRVSALSVEEIREKVQQAKAASKYWSATSPVQRGVYLRKAAQLLEERMDDIAQCATEEMGKRFVETKGEVKRGADILRFYAEEGMRMKGEVLPSSKADTLLYYMREPLGVVAVIAPWNFPIAIPVWKIAPALIYGNTVLFKPASETVITAQKIAKVFHDVGIPEGVLQFVPGRGSVVGGALATNEQIDGITFTGSNIVGQQVAQQAIASGMELQLELGGKNPAIVLQDADLDHAAKLVVDGAMKQTGQRCTATSRVYIEEDVYDRFKMKVLERVSNVVVGDSLHEEVDIGPLASESQLESVLHYIRKGVEEGASLLYGGEQIDRVGYFVEPAVFENVTQEMTIMQEEIFGPVICLKKVANYEEAVQAANDTKYGLSASLFTNNLTKAMAYTRESEVGMVQINGETGGAEPQAPFGGTKSSSFGAHEQGQSAKEFFTKHKTVSWTPNK
ncbi:aldehyde dehydrogenase family protein [Pontibacillus litoralis]|uniref:aldehyde dehydrogenase family protein n=1 Tax=Pontibacillus litoralis TaxID=516703 RepID=UPI00056BB3A1|nr:aldehyde dehydrogenase family protein [Pontibacillus litoralis]